MEPILSPGGDPENFSESWNWRTLGHCFTLDGQMTTFYRLFDPDDNYGRPRTIVMSVEGNLTYIPLSVFDSLGEGDPARGLQVIVAFLAETECSRAKTGSISPVLTEVLYPHYGGAQAYRDAVREDI